MVSKIVRVVGISIDVVRALAQTVFILTRVVKTEVTTVE
jgi:hypothetical protein